MTFTAKEVNLMQPWRVGQDRLVINERLLLHLNNLIVSKTRINHISDARRKIIWHNLSKLVVNWSQQ